MKPDRELTPEERYLPAIAPPAWLVDLLGEPHYEPDTMTAWAYNRKRADGPLIACNIFNSYKHPRYIVNSSRGETLAEAINNAYAATPSNPDVDRLHSACFGKPEGHSRELAIFARGIDDVERKILKGVWRPEVNRLILTAKLWAHKTETAEVVLTRDEARGWRDWLTKILQDE